jgi:hypothetical protein
MIVCSDIHVDFSIITIALLYKATDRPPVTDKHYRKTVVWSTDCYGWESSLHILIVALSDYIGKDNPIFLPQKLPS